MPGQYSKPPYNQVALTVAAGSKIPAWAREHRVAVRTADHWYMSGSFKQLVREYRRRAVDRAIAKIAKNLTKAVESIVRLIEEGQNDSVKLSAAKILIDKVIDVESHSELKAELHQINERLLAQERKRADSSRESASSSPPA